MRTLRNGIRRTAGAIGSLLIATTLLAPGATAQQEMTGGERDEARHETTKGASLMAVLEANPRFSGFVAMVKAANLADRLDEDGPFTLFVPTNAALQRLDASGLKGQARANERVREIVLAHLIDEKISSAELAGRGEVSPQHRLVPDAIEPSSHRVTVEDGRIVIGENANVVATDIEAANGVIHVINRPLAPRNPALETSDDG